MKKTLVHLLYNYPPFFSGASLQAKSLIEYINEREKVDNIIYSLDHFNNKKFINNKDHTNLFRFNNIFFLALNLIFNFKLRSRNLILIIHGGPVFILIAFFFKILINRKAKIIFKISYVNELNRLRKLRFFIYFGNRNLPSMTL